MINNYNQDELMKQFSYADGCGGFGEGTGGLEVIA